MKAAPTNDLLAKAIARSPAGGCAGAGRGVRSRWSFVSG